MDANIYFSEEQSYRNTFLEREENRDFKLCLSKTEKVTYMNFCRKKSDASKYIKGKRSV